MATTKKTTKKKTTKKKTVKVVKPLNCFWFYGDEGNIKHNVDIILDKFLDGSGDISEIDSKCSFDDLISEMTMRPIWGGKKVIILDGLIKDSEKLVPNIPKIPTGNLLIITTDKIDKRLKLTKFVDKHGRLKDLGTVKDKYGLVDNKVKSSLRLMIVRDFDRLGYNIDEKAADSLALRCDYNKAIVDSEINKIVLYKGDDKQVSFGDVDLLACDNEEYNTFVFMNYLLKDRDAKQAIKYINSFDKGKYDSLAGTIANRLRLLVMVKEATKRGEPMSVMLDLVGTKNPGYIYALQSQTKGLNSVRAIRSINAITNLRMSIRGYHLSSDVDTSIMLYKTMFQNIILNLCGVIRPEFFLPTI